jgi:hypothetical protein
MGLMWIKAIPAEEFRLERMRGFWRHIGWQMMAGLLVLTFVILPVSLSSPHGVTRGQIPCLHFGETVKAGMPVPAISAGEREQPCDGHDCPHGSFCCTSSCLAFTGLVVNAMPSLAAPVPGAAAYAPHLASWLHGFGLRPALPPPRAFV